MLKIAKMDMYRFTHSTITYVCMGFITMMAVAMTMSSPNTSFDTLMGVATNVPKEDAFMTSVMGAGVINILLGITLALFVSSDFSSGFAKNIFTVHAKARDYIFGKLISFSLLSSFLLLFYIIESIFALQTLGSGLRFSSSILGVIFFVLEKWFISIAFCSVILLLTLLTRKAAWGIIVGFIIATGGISMMIPSLASFLHWNWLNIFYGLTLSGASTSIGMVFHFMNLLHIIAVGVGWLLLSTAITTQVMGRKDIC